MVESSARLRVPIEVDEGVPLYAILIKHCKQFCERIIPSTPCRIQLQWRLPAVRLQYDAEMEDIPGLKVLITALEIYQYVFRGALELNYCWAIFQLKTFSSPFAVSQIPSRGFWGIIEGYTRQGGLKSEPAIDGPRALWLETAATIGAFASSSNVEKCNVILAWEVLAGPVVRRMHTVGVLVCAERPVEMFQESFPRMVTSSMDIFSENI